MQVIVLFFLVSFASVQMQAQYCDTLDLPSSRTVRAGIFDLIVVGIEVDGANCFDASRSETITKEEFIDDFIYSDTLVVDVLEPDEEQFKIITDTSKASLIQLIFCQEGKEEWIGMIRDLYSRYTGEYISTELVAWIRLN